MQPTVFALADCDNFYVSCERVFDPRLRQRPVAVLSNNDGCIVARSPEVKALGIAMGTPLFKCASLVKIHDIAVRSSNYTLYGDMSDRVMQILARFTPDLEVYSIDEAFLSLAGFQRRGLTDYARTIRATVHTWTGIPITIGIGATKLQAKIAAHIGKKEPGHGHVFNLLDVDDVDAVLDTIAVGDLWGIGGQSAKALGRAGIHTAREFKYAEPVWVRKRLHVVGRRLQLELQGVSSLPLEEMAAKKSICCSRSFGRPVTSLDDLREAVALYATHAAEKLRKQRSFASALSVFLTTNRFKPHEPQYARSMQFTIPRPTSDTLELIDYAHRCLDQIYQPGYRFKKAGIILLDLIPSDRFQADMFWPELPEKRARLMEVVDQINTRYGPHKIAPAAIGRNTSWHMRRTMKSPNYTTDWRELPLVRTCSRTRSTATRPQGISP